MNKNQFSLYYIILLSKEISFKVHIHSSHSLVQDFVSHFRDKTSKPEKTWKVVLLGSIIYKVI